MGKYTEQELFAKLGRAHAAGDAEAATAIAAEIRSVRAQAQPPTAEAQPQAQPQPQEQPEQINIAGDIARGVTRGGLTGFTSLPTLAGDAIMWPARELYKLQTGRPITKVNPNDDQLTQALAKLLNPSKGFQSAFREVGIDPAETAAGRVIGDIAAGVSGSLGGVGLGKQLAQSGVQSVSRLGSILSASPKIQALAGGAAGLGAGTAKESGVGAGGQFLAALASGMIGPAALSGLARGAMHAAAPLSANMSKDRIASQLRDVLGPQFDDVIARLESAKPNMSGVAMTAGEVAGVPAISTLQRTAMQTNPQIGQVVGSAMDDAMKAAVERLRSSAGGNADDLISAREAATSEGYNALANMDVPLTPLMPNRIAPQKTVAATGDDLYSGNIDTGFMDFLQNLTKTKSGSAAMGHAVDVAKNRAAAAGINPDTISGIIPSNATHINGAPLMDIKKAIAELIEKRPEGLSTNSIKVLQAAYQKKLRQYFPQYKAIDDQFAEMSKGVNQAQIIEEVAKRGLGAIDDVIKPSSLARALSAKDLPKTATKSSYSRWKDLTAAQRSTMSDLIRFAKGRDRFSNAGKAGGGSDTAQKLEYAKILDGAGLPSWLSGAAGAKTGGVSKLFEMLYRDAARNRTGSVLSELFLDPAKLAAAMKNAPKKPDSLMLRLQSNTLPSAQAGQSSSNR